MVADPSTPLRSARDDRECMLRIASVEITSMESRIWFKRRWIPAFAGMTVVNIEVKGKKKPRTVQEADNIEGSGCAGFYLANI